VGPRVQTSIVMLSQTGGHADLYLAGAALESSYLFLDYPGRPPFVVDGPDQVRRAVRQLIRDGADWIKIAATGGLVSDFDDPLMAGFTAQELEVVMTEANRRNRPVAAHAFGGEGLADAVRAGARSIEHGAFLTEEQASLMADHDCWLVPTLSALREVVTLAREDRLTATQHEKVMAANIEAGAAVRIAKEYGVRFACGSDFFTRDQHGGNLGELALMREAGLTAPEVLYAATASGAELCGVGDLYGRIAPGFVFDAVLLDEDPADLSSFHERGVVTGVFKNGEAIVPHERLIGRSV
jgi:imidazolonepropionase-like amidohydrolase